MGLNRIRWGRITTLLLSAGLISVFFQNCGQAKFKGSSSSDQKNLQGGGGIDGKLKYLNYGTCATSTAVEVKEVLVVASDRSEAAKMREECKDLAAPVPVDPASLQFVLPDPNGFLVNGTLFDLQTTAPEQKVTLAFCQSPAAKVTVWKEMNGSSSYHGQVVRSDGATSGDVLVQLPTKAGEYQSVSSGANSFQLDVNTGGLTYALSTGSPVTVSGMNCNMQSLPAQAAVVNLMSNTGFESGLASWTNWGNSINTSTGAYLGGSSVQVGLGLGGVYQDVTSKVTIGVTYSLSFATKLGSTSETTGEVGVECMAPGSVVLFDRHIKPASTNWVASSFTFSCPSGSTEILVYVYKGAGPSYVFADDFVLSQY